MSWLICVSFQFAPRLLLMSDRWTSTVWQARQSIRKAWLLPWWKPSSNCRCSLSVRSITLIFPIVVLIALQYWFAGVYNKDGDCWLFSTVPVFVFHQPKETAANSSDFRKKLFLFFPVPELPACESLQKKHLKPILYNCATFATFCHEQCFVRVVKQVIKKCMAVHSLIREGRTYLCVRIHAKRGAVDDDIILSD